MNGRLEVASAALERQVLEISIDVTFHTSHRLVASFQGERCAAVIKTRHPVRPIMAIKTVLTEIGQVLHHKCRIVLAVAINAILSGCFEIFVVQVTTGAVQGRGRVIHLVPNQAEAGYSVVEVIICIFPGIEFASAMIAMAFKAHLNILQDPVQTTHQD